MRQLADFRLSIQNKKQSAIIVERTVKLFFVSKEPFTFILNNSCKVRNMRAPVRDVRLNTQQLNILVHIYITGST